MRGGQLATVLVAPAGLVLHLLELVLGQGGALPGLGRGDLQPVHFLLRGHGAAVRRADLLAQPGDPPGLRGRGLGALGLAAFGRGELPLGGGALGGGDGEHLAPGRQPLVQALLFLPQLVGLAVELVGVAAGALGL